jgi:hypothetical protein
MAGRLNALITEMRLKKETVKREGDALPGTLKFADLDALNPVGSVGFNC